MLKESGAIKNRLLIAAAAVLAAWGNVAQGEPVHHFRTLDKPDVLYVADSPNSEQFAELLRHVVPAEVTFAPLSYGHLELHHLCDKPLEESKQDQEYVLQQGREYVDAMLDRLGQFDVIIAQFQPQAKDAEWNGRLFAIQERIIERVRNGGKLIFINPSWETTFQGTPLAEVVPVKFVTHRAWSTGTLGATDHPLSRGLPLEVVGAHWWGPVYEPVDDSCVPLTRAESDGRRSLKARFWHRRLPGGGEVVHLFQAGGGKWQWGTGSYGTYDAERPDDAAAWNAFYRRLIYGLAYGDRAFPVLAKVDLPAEARCRTGGAFAIPVDVENRSGKDRTVAVVLEVSHRRSTEKLTFTESVALTNGARQTTTFEAEVDLPCTDPYLLVRAQARDAAGQTILSESTAWVPYEHTVPLTVKTPKHGYQPGEPINATLAWDARAKPGEYVARVYIVDRTGRVHRSVILDRVVVGEKAGELRSGDIEMPDWGPEFASCYWVTAVLEEDGQIAGTARTQVFMDRPWDMRNQFQWSLWSHGGGERTLALYRDAGFNSLGMQGNPANAERNGWRQYVEGTGINTFGVTIDHDNWDDVRAAMEQTIAGQNEGGPDSRSKVLVSLGEESGFKWGWGARYYWPERTAPEVPQKVFDDYLSELYNGRIEDLNREWGTGYKAFSEIPLEQAKVKAPSNAFVTSQAWEAMQEKGDEKDVFPVDVQKIDPEQKYIATSAPYYETHRFFDWYYQKYCDIATEVYRTRRNPVPLTIMSAPGGFYPKVDVYNFGGLGPFYPKEISLVGNAVARRDYGDVPGFSAAMWAYFDLRSLWSCTVLSSILAGNTHIDYWVDIPLTFNADLTHTRASFWTKVLREKLHPIEPILLHKRFAYTDGLGVYTAQQPLGKGILGKHFGSAVSCNAPVYSAMEKSGCMPRVVHANDLKGIRVLVASYAQVVSPEEGRQIAEFVRGGGLLIATPWLASCSPHGNPLTVYPAEETGLVELLGFRLLNTSQEVVNERVKVERADRFAVPAELTLQSKGRDAVLNIAPDVEVLARYEDETPLLLARNVGEGGIIYLNCVYDWDGWWNAFYSPERQAYRKLLDGIIRSGGVAPEYFIAFESAEEVDDSKGWWGMQMRTAPDPGDSVAWWGSQLYCDPGGRMKYLAVFSDHRSPKITARLNWARPGVRIFDLFNGAEIPTAAGPPALTLRPGEAAFWAVAEQFPDALAIQAPERLAAGAQARISMTARGAAPGAVHGVVLDVYGPSGQWSRAHSVNADAPGGRIEVTIPTALNDPPGMYRVVARESTTRLSAETRFELVTAVPGTGRANLTPFPGRLGETWPVSTMSSEEFLGLLRRLRAIYEGTYEGLEAKYMLSYYLNVPFRPSNRHAVVRRLQRTDWTPHLQAVAAALRAGERFYLVGEDVNVDPLTGKTIDPFAVADIRAFLRALARTQDADFAPVDADGVKLQILEIGEGALVMTEASVDRAAYHSSDFAAWHERLKQALKGVPEPGK